jgi:branched-chain amino acid transport system ATP-binding protein
MTVPILGLTWGAFFGVFVPFAFAAFMTGQALAQTWRPYWHAVPYAALLGVGQQFLGYALFEGKLLLVGWLVDSAILLAVVTLAYRLTLAHKMVSQYPWLYERAGLFAWREKRPGN